MISNTPFVIRQFTTTLFMVFFYSMGTAQDMYFLPYQIPGIENTHRKLAKYNPESCQFQILYDFEDHIESGVISPVSLSFHPDGRLYMISESRLLAFNVLTRRIDKILPLRSFDLQRLILEDDFAYLAISEEGRVLISEDFKDQSNTGFRYIDYDLRHNHSLRYSTSEDLFGDPEVNLPIGGFLQNNNPIFLVSWDQVLMVNIPGRLILLRITI